MNTLQRLINKVNAKQNFTYNLTNNRERYIVSIKSVYNGLNPSIDFDLITKVSKIISASTSLKLAKVNQQKAIFDSKKNLVIYLNNI